MTIIDGEKRTLKIEYENKISDVKHQLRSLKNRGASNIRCKEKCISYPTLCLNALNKLCSYIIKNENKNE